MRDGRSAAYTLVNIFTPKEGDTDALIHIQLEETRLLRPASAAAGWRGNEVYRARDGIRVIVVTRFISAEAQARWATSPHFKEHLTRIGPLLASVESIPVESIARHVADNESTLKSSWMNFPGAGQRLDGRVCRASR